jgi:hypothetical protein
LDPLRFSLLEFSRNLRFMVFIKMGSQSTIRSALITALISSLLGFATVADFANVETSAWVGTAGIITAHPVPCLPALAAASAGWPFWISGDAKQKPVNALPELSSAAGECSSRYNAQHDPADRCEPGRFSVISGRSPPHSTSRL